MLSGSKVSVAGCALKTERIARKVYRTRKEAKADVFDYIERFRRHSTIGYVSPVEFERKLGLALNRLSTKSAAAQRSRVGDSQVEIASFRLALPVAPAV